MTVTRGLFITLEGSDGAGKSTHIKFIKKYLLSKGLEVILVREPGGTIVGEQLRQILLGLEPLNNITEVLLMFASRQELIDKIIEPNLAKGVCVLADRFIDSSLAYQGAARGIGAKRIWQLINMLDKFTLPDLTFLFDIPLKTARARVLAKSHLDRIEQEDLDFFNKVHLAYRHLAVNNSERVKLISTNVTITQTHENLVHYLDELLLTYNRVSN